MDTTSLADLWDEVFGSQPDPDLWVVIATAVAALAAVVPQSLWRLSRNAITIAHEGGHGLVALLTGRTLTGIRLHSDTSGLTVSRGKPTGLGMILTAAAGYTAPPLLGLGGAALLAAGHITALLWLATVLLMAVLVMIRNAYGALTVVIDRRHVRGGVLAGRPPGAGGVRVRGGVVPAAGRRTTGLRTPGQAAPGREI